MSRAAAVGHAVAALQPPGDAVVAVAEVDQHAGVVAAAGHDLVVLVLGEDALEQVGAGVPEDADGPAGRR